MKTLIGRKTDISIIIPNYRSKRYLEENIFSISNKIEPQVQAEIIIVNNDKKENLEDIKNRFSNIQVIDHGKNIGFGAAINLGAKKASGEYLFFLNPDCKIISQNIKKVINEFKIDRNVGIIGSQLRGIDNRVQKWIAGTEMTMLDLIRNNLGFPSSRKIWISKHKIKSHWVSGAAMFIKKELFDKLGGFDKEFFMYFEDVDLCKRVRKAGKDVYFFPDFKVRHLGGGSCENKENQKKNYFSSQRYYFKKHNGKMESCILKILQGTFKLK